MAAREQERAAIPDSVERDVQAEFSVGAANFRTDVTVEDAADLRVALLASNVQRHRVGITREQRRHVGRAAAPRRVDERRVAVLHRAQRKLWNKFRCAEEETRGESQIDA